MYVWYISFSFVLHLQNNYSDHCPSTFPIKQVKQLQGSTFPTFIAICNHGVNKQGFKSQINFESIEAVSQNLRKFANLLRSKLREDLNKKSEIRAITFLRIKRIIFLKLNVISLISDFFFRSCLSMLCSIFSQILGNSLYIIGFFFGLI